MSDFPFSIPRRGDADVVNGVSYAGTTLTLTRAEGSDLTTTIATSDPTKIENGTSKMEIDTLNGACVFTPAGSANTTTFATDGDITTSGDIIIPQVYAAAGTSNKLLFKDNATLTPFGDAGINFVGGPTGNENGGSHLNFFTNNASRLSIIQNGNVGIGTTIPSQKLHVAGNIKCSAVVEAVRSTINDATVDTAINNLLTQRFTTAAGYTAFDKSIILSRSTGYRPFEVGLLGNNIATSNTNVFCIAGNGGGGNDPDPIFAAKEDGTCEIAGDFYAVNVRASTTVYAAGSPLTSDDRIKENEKLIVNATETLSKLTPQIYDKYRTMDLSGSFFVESGLIAQEVYYNTPELRHLVYLGKELDTSGNEYTPTPEEMDLSDVDIANDPDYGSHGWSKTEHSWLNYQGLIPYLIKSNQELEARLAALENK